MNWTVKLQNVDSQCVPSNQSVAMLRHILWSKHFKLENIFVEYFKKLTF